MKILQIAIALIALQLPSVHAVNEYAIFQGTGGINSSSWFYSASKNFWIQVGDDAHDGWIYIEYNWSVLGQSFSRGDWFYTSDAIWFYDNTNGWMYAQPNWPTPVYQPLGNSYVTHDTFFRKASGQSTFVYYADGDRVTVPVFWDPLFNNPTIYLNP